MTLTVGMSDGIIAISRREEPDSEELSENREVKAVKSVRQRSKKFVDFVATDYGLTKEEGVVRKFLLFPVLLLIIIMLFISYQSFYCLLQKI